MDVETFKVTVLNVAPAVTITGGQPELDEGDQFTAAGSFTDPGADAWTATVDYGDGTGVSPLTLNPDKTFALDHTYLDNGNFTVTVRVFDGFEYGTATFDGRRWRTSPRPWSRRTTSRPTRPPSREFDLGSFTDFGVERRAVDRRGELGRRVRAASLRDHCSRGCSVRRPTPTPTTARTPSPSG